MTPAPTRSAHVPLADGESVMVYVTADGRVVLPVRRLAHGTDDPAAASLESGVSMDAAGAVRVALERLESAKRDGRPPVAPADAARGSSGFV